MDDFSWGNTRLIVGEGSNKKVIMNEDEKFDDSMIPLRKFSEYEAEAWETGSRHSDETGYSASKARSRGPGSRAPSPRSFHPSQSGGDYYRDTNLTDKNASNRPPGSNQSHYGGGPAMSQYGGMPQLPMMPFGAGPGSVHGSDYGGQMPMPMAYQHSGSMYGMMPQAMPMAPRNTVMTSMNMFGGDPNGSQLGFAPPMAPGLQQSQRPMSTFSMATSVNPFAQGPSMNPDPSDEEVVGALRAYLSTQDLMTVTKK